MPVGQSNQKKTRAMVARSNEDGEEAFTLYSGWLQLDVLMHAKRRKVHDDDNGAVVLLTNCTSFISIF